MGVGSNHTSGKPAEIKTPQVASSIATPPQHRASAPDRRHAMNRHDRLEVTALTIAESRRACAPMSAAQLRAAGETVDQSIMKSAKVVAQPVETPASRDEETGEWVTVESRKIDGETVKQRKVQRVLNWDGSDPSEVGVIPLPASKVEAPAPAKPAPAPVAKPAPAAVAETPQERKKRERADRQALVRRTIVSLAASRGITRELSDAEIRTLTPLALDYIEDRDQRAAYFSHA